MKAKFVALIFLVIIVGVLSQATKPSKPSGAPSKPSSKSNTGNSRKAKENNGSIKSTTVSGARTKSKVGDPTTTKIPVYTTPKPAPEYTCDNATGMSKFDFTKFATGTWILSKELTAWPFSYSLGQCVTCKFTLDTKNSKKSSVIYNSLIEGVFENSPVSTLTANDKTSSTGIVEWNITTVGLKKETLNANTNLKYIIIDTDYNNYAAIYACGQVCVYMSSSTKAPKISSPSCSPGAVHQFMILLRKRNYTEAENEKYINLATAALNDKWPFRPFMPVDQNTKICTN